MMTAGELDDDQLEKEIRYQRWSLALQEYVSKDLYKYIQFVNSDDDCMYGSKLQAIVCARLRIPEGERVEFWTNVGADRCVEILKRKRQTISCNMKVQFESK
jgi:hypothetical protein